jgi:hypothetical protein
MQFIKKDNICKITRMTGNTNNILDISFGNKDSTENDIEVIEWHFPNIPDREIQTSKTELLKQVLSGLNHINQSCSTNYRLVKIYYVPFES